MTEGHTGATTSHAMAIPPDELLLAFLRDSDAPCPVCTYNLRGIRQPRCPECNSLLNLAVGSIHTRLGPWLLATSAFVLAIGFDGVVSVLLIAGRIAFPPRSPADQHAVLRLMAIFFSLTAASSLGLILLLRLRRAWHHLSPRRQWPLAWMIFLAVGLLHVAIGLWIATHYV